MEPEPTSAAVLVPRPNSTRVPPTSWMTAAYHPGQVPAESIGLPSTPKSDAMPWQVKSSPTTIRNRLSA